MWGKLGRKKKREKYFIKIIYVGVLIFWKWKWLFSNSQIDLNVTTFQFSMRYKPHENLLKSESKTYWFCKSLMSIWSLSHLYKSSIAHLVSVKVSTFNFCYCPQNLWFCVSLLFLPSSTNLKESASFSCHTGNYHIWIKKVEEETFL